jgi:RES domain-containing protein
MKLWRIATETRQYSANDLSGTGAAKHPGRWNADKEPVVYCAPTIALAVLETSAHIDDNGLPLNRFVVAIDVPADVWKKRETLKVKDLPGGWDAIPAGFTSIQLGSGWLGSRRTPILVVPSVIVPEEPICLINPQHADAHKIKAKTIRRFEYNRLFRGR